MAKRKLKRSWEVHRAENKNSRIIFGLRKQICDLCLGQKTVAGNGWQRHRRSWLVCRSEQGIAVHYFLPLRTVNLKKTKHHCASNFCVKLCQTNHWSWRVKMLPKSSWVSSWKTSYKGYETWRHAYNYWLRRPPKCGFAVLIAPQSKDLWPPPCPPGQDWLPTSSVRAARLLASNRSPLPWKAVPVPGCGLPWAHSARIHGCSSLFHVCHPLSPLMEFQHSHSLFPHSLPLSLPEHLWEKSLLGFSLSLFARPHDLTSLVLITWSRFATV